MNLDYLKRLGLDIKPGTGTKGRSGQEFQMCCPFCITRGHSPDKGYRLGFNIKKKIYHCYRCGKKGPLKDLKELELLNFYTPDDGYEEIKKKLNEKNNILELSDYNLDIMSYPISMEETPIAYNYMINKRGYSPEELIRYNVRVGKRFIEKGEQVNKWAGRVIFPYFYEEQCIYLVGRSYTDKEPKYLNTPEPKTLVVYGLDDIKGKIVILCEGIISAHAAQRYTGISAVAMLGKSPLDSQLNRLRHKCKIVYQCWDGDVSSEERLHNARKMISMGFEVWDIDMPTYETVDGKTVGHDPDSLKEEFVHYFNQAKRINFF